MDGRSITSVGGGGRWLGLAMAGAWLAACGTSGNVRHAPPEPDSGAGGTTMAGTGGTGTGGNGGTAGTAGTGGAAPGGATGTDAGTDAAATDTGTDAEPADASGTDSGGAASGVVTGVVVQYTDLRQGAGSFTVTVNGTGLSNPTAFDFQGLTVTGMKAGATDTTFDLACSVPHGAPLGPKSLGFKIGNQQITQKNVVTITPITASPSGNDGKRGTTSNPLRTYKQALLDSASGDIVQLMDGTYDVPGGEDFNEPLPDGVTLRGQSLNTFLYGPAEQGSNPTVAGVAAAGNATISTLTIKYFLDGIDTTGAGTVAIDDVVASSNSRSGLRISGATTVEVTNKLQTTSFSNQGSNGSGVYVDNVGAVLSLDGTHIDSNPYAGLYVNQSSATVTMTGGEINLNGGTGYGAIFYNSPPAAAPLSLTMNGTVIQDDGYYSVYLQAGYVLASFTNVDFRGVFYTLPADTGSTLSKITLTNCTAEVPTAAAPNGTVKDVFGRFISGSVTITGTTITGFPFGLWELGGSMKLRGTTVALAATGTTHTVYVSGGIADLGTAVEAGNNTLTYPAAQTEGIYDARSNVLVPISVSHTTFNGVTPAAGPVNASVPGKYIIANAGSIVFY